MIEKHDFPVLEFDPDKDAILTPAVFARHPLNADRLVITFFPEVVEKMLTEGGLAIERVIPGENTLTVYRFTDDPGVLLVTGSVGCPACAGNLDLLQGMGIRKVMFCGGGGVLDGSIAVGKLLLVEGAIRDEGFSYHYVAPSRVIYADEGVNAVIRTYLTEQGVPFLPGLTWTTDALFRETAAKMAQYKSEGAKMVEMEQAGCLAVARARSLAYGALIYGGDDLSGESWDNRGWRSVNGLRYDLVNLCRELVKKI